MVDLGITGSDPKQTSAGMMPWRATRLSFNDVIEYRANGIRLPPDKGLEKFDRDIKE
jgi:hypothetical protein